MAVTEPCIYLKIYNEIQGKSPSPHYSDVSQQKGLLLGAVHYTGQYSLSYLYVMAVQRQVESAIIQQLQSSRQMLVLLPLELAKVVLQNF